LHQCSMLIHSFNHLLVFCIIYIIYICQNDLLWLLVCEKDLQRRHVHCFMKLKYILINPVLIFYNDKCMTGSFCRDRNMFAYRNQDCTKMYLEFWYCLFHSTYTHILVPQ
jgi:hypothetical protein